MKEILIYGDIQSQSAKDFVTEMAQAAGEDITVRVNTPGGEPEYMWGMIAKFKEHTGAKILKLDGMAYSGGTFLPCYADAVECLDTTKFLLHRAAYSAWFEQNPDYFTEPLKLNLQQINADLEKAFRNKVDVKLFEELTGKKIKEVFSMEQRLDVFFDASVAKKVGLVNTIIKITPAKKAELDVLSQRAAAKYNKKPGTESEHQTQTEENQKTKNTMDIKKLQEEHPAVYAAAVAAGVSEGVTKERERVKSHLVFMDIDPKQVKEDIEKGADLPASKMAEYNRKAASAGALTNIGTDSSKTVKTAEELATEAEAKKKIAADAEAEIRAVLNLKS